MEVTPVVVIGAIALMASIPLLVWGLVASPRRSEDLIQRNLSGARAAVDERRITLEQSAVERAILPAVRNLAARVRRMTPAGWMEQLERRHRLAGGSRTWTVERILSAKIIFGLLGAMYAVVLLSSGFTLNDVLVSVFVVMLGYFGPDAILWGRAQERQAAIALALPDTLDQMTISVEAGLGFDAAMRRTAQVGHGPLAEELRRVLAELKVGATRRKAFQNLLDRTDVPELRHFVFAVQQADEYGLPIAHVLRVQAGELRIKRRQRAEEEALKLPVKLVFPLVVCIFPTLFIVLLGPAALRISRVLF